MTLPRPYGRPRPGQRPDRWSDMLRGAAIAVVVLGMVVSGLVAKGWHATTVRQRHERLDRAAASRTATIENVMANYENALQAARSLWVASDSVNRREFNAFARSLDLRDRYPGLQGIGWRSYVTDARRAAFLARARAGEPGFSIRPAGRRPVYYVNLYSYPRIPSSSTLGVDARAIPGDLATLDQARDSGKATVSDRTTLAGDLDLPPRERPVAFELVVPVYRQELPADASVAERRREIDGWATGQFRAGDFLNDAMRTWRTQQFTGVELSDGAVPGGGPLASYPEGFRARGPDVQQERFSFGGRTFVLRFAPLPGNPILTDRTILAPVVLAVGVALSVLFGVMLWLLAQVGALYQEVRRLARTDSLTGVPNRRAWDEELPRELARATRSRRPVCVALLDLDHFKQYNDRHGHQAGDRFLKEAAAAWQAVVRKTDLVARYGGEEFAILLPDCELDDAMEIAERLLTAQPEGTCSLGVAQWDGREDVTSLVARADRALYAAKDAGRDRIHTAAPATVGTAAP